MSRRHATAGQHLELRPTSRFSAQDAVGRSSSQSLPRKAATEDSEAFSTFGAFLGQQSDMPTLVRPSWSRTYAYASDGFDRWRGARDWYARASWPSVDWPSGSVLPGSSAAWARASAT